MLSARVTGAMVWCVGSDPEVRTRVEDALAARLAPRSIAQVTLEADAQNVWERITEAAGEGRGRRTRVVSVALDADAARSSALQLRLNVGREVAVSRRLGMLVWVPLGALEAFARGASDLWSVRADVVHCLSPKDFEATARERGPSEDEVAEHKRFDELTQRGKAPRLISRARIEKMDRRRAAKALASNMALWEQMFRWVVASKMVGRVEETERIIDEIEASLDLKEFPAEERWALVNVYLQRIHVLSDRDSLKRLQRIASQATRLAATLRDDDFEGVSLIARCHMEWQRGDIGALIETAHRLTGSPRKVTWDMVIVPTLLTLSGGICRLGLLTDARMLVEEARALRLRAHEVSRIRLIPMFGLAAENWEAAERARIEEARLDLLAALQGFQSAAHVAGMTGESTQHADLAEHISQLHHALGYVSALTSPTPPPRPTAAVLHALHRAVVEADADLAATPQATRRVQRAMHFHSVNRGDDADRDLADAHALLDTVPLRWRSRVAMSLLARAECLRLAHRGALGEALRTLRELDQLLVAEGLAALRLGVLHAMVQLPPALDAEDHRPAVLRDALRLVREAGHLVEETRFLADGAVLARQREEHDEAQRLADEALSMARELGLSDVIEALSVRPT